MEKAGVEEYEMAIQCGDITENGIPFITVYLDGGWSKRSYGHSYKAASGVVYIYLKLRSHCEFHCIAIFF